MRRLITATLLSLLACSSCLSHAPAGVDGGAVQTQLFIRAELTGTTVAMVVVEVTASDIPTPLVFNIPTVNGVGMSDAVTSTTTMATVVPVSSALMNSRACTAPPSTPAGSCDRHELHAISDSKIGRA